MMSDCDVLFHDGAVRAKDTRYKRESADPGQKARGRRGFAGPIRLVNRAVCVGSGVGSGYMGPQTLTCELPAAPAAHVPAVVAARSVNRTAWSVTVAVELGEAQ